MKVIGIIAEYNPFHNGHKYHINKIKELYPDSILILVLNGYFLMRGEISIQSKQAKTQIALKNAVDLVIELPFFFGSNSADIFALSSVKILNDLKCDLLIFGSESNDISLLKEMAKKQLSKGFNNKVKLLLKTGVNYPTAIGKSLSNNINNPNDLLGISYIKAIKMLKSKIIPETIQRTNDYHDINSNDLIISATNIRNKINNNEKITNYLSEYSITKINRINRDLLFSLIKYQIITNPNLANILSVDEGLDQKIIKTIMNANSFEELNAKIKSKRYTYNRINRMLIHILIGLSKKDKEKHNLPEFIKVLGFNHHGQKYLNTIKKQSVILISSKIPDCLIKDYELKVAKIYQMLTNEDVIKFENSNQPIIFDN